MTTIINGSSVNAQGYSQSSNSVQQTLQNSRRVIAPATLVMPVVDFSVAAVNSAGVLAHQSSITPKVVGSTIEVEVSIAGFAPAASLWWSTLLWKDSDTVPLGADLMFFTTASTALRSTFKARFVTTSLSPIDLKVRTGYNIAGYNLYISSDNVRNWFANVTPMSSVVVRELIGGS